MTDIPPEPGSPTWTRLVTASKIAAIIGVSPWDSPFSMWRRMKGFDPADDGNNATEKRRGAYLEPAILAWWEDQHPDHDVVSRQHYSTRADMPWAAATPDMLTTSGGEYVGVEAKSAARMDDWGEPGTDQIPVYYLTQVYWQLALEPRMARVRIPVIGPGLAFVEYVVERDEAIQDDLIRRAKTFYDSLADEIPPPLDDHVATFESVKRQHPDIEDGQVATISAELAHQYVTAALAFKAAEDVERATKTLVLDAAGRAHRINDPSGVKIARRQRNKTGVSLVRVAKHYEPETTP